jgi:predicted N-formylglutamate amidohydrolase
MPASLPGKLPLLVEFVLEDKEGNEVYTANFRTSGTSGIVTLSLPTQGGLSPLVVGKDYKWFFSVVCQEDDRSKDAVVEGWVRRVELKPTLKTQLAQASLQKQVELYAEAEIWQDALATLVQLRRDKPNDSAIAADWAKLLSAAGLDNIAQESLLPIPTAPRVSVR